MRIVFILCLLLAPVLSTAEKDMEEWRKTPSTPAPNANAPSGIKANLEVKEQKQEEVQVIQNRLSQYNQRGMDYASKLFSMQDGSKEDETRQKKSDALGYKLRAKTIAQTKMLLNKTNDPRVMATLLKRLAELYEKQSNSEQILFSTGPKAQQYKATIQQAIDIRSDLLRKHKSYISPDIILFSLAENYMTLDDTKRAETNYIEVTKFPKSIFLSDAFLALGNLRYTQKNFSGARIFYGKILDLKNSPLLAYAHYKIAWAYFNEGNESAANSELVNAIKASRSLTKSNKRRLDVEEEAIRDLVLFYAESSDPRKAKDYFISIVGKEDAKEMRYMLARRYFSHDKHKEAFLVATELLSDNPPDNQAGQLLMIMLSISEKTRQRESSVASAHRLSGWVLKTNEKIKAPPQEESDKVDREELHMILGDAEETIRRLCQRLHYDAQKGEKKELWKLGKESYEIYFATYKNGTELAEMRYRYAALLYKINLNVDAYENTKILLGMINNSHPRFQEVLKLRIQVIEQASSEQRKILDDKKLITAYDEFAKSFPKDNLAVEAMFKAATLAKKEEGPEKAAERFRVVAQNYPYHKLRDTAVKESLGTLLSSQKWEKLADESKLLINIVAGADDNKSGGKLLQNGKVDEEKFENSDLYKQLLNARNTALVKIAEEYEAKEKYNEAEQAYLDFINSRKNSTLRPMALMKLAYMTENKTQNYLNALKYWDQIGQEYSNTKEGQLAELEKARIHEKIMQPKNAVVDYINFSQKGKSKLHRTSLTNAAVILESIGEWNLAADNFLRLYQWLKTDKELLKDAAQALEFSCKNRLLASSTVPESEVYEKLYQCAHALENSYSKESILWKIRAAWSLEKLGKSSEALEIWQQVAANKKTLLEKDEYAVFYALARTKQLIPELVRFKSISFEKTNEKPDANIAKKAQALEKVEHVAGDIMKYGTSQQIELARRALHAAYINFGDTLDSSAVPKGMSDIDKATLKKSLHEAAMQMREKAKEFIMANDKSATEEKQEKKAPRSYPSLGSKEFKELVLRASKNPADVEAYARLAWHMFDIGEYGTARYIATKWETQLKKGAKADSQFSEGAYEQFWDQISLKMPMQDPVVLDLQKISNTQAQRSE